MTILDIDKALNNINAARRNMEALAVVQNDNGDEIPWDYLEPALFALDKFRSEIMLRKLEFEIQLKQNIINNSSAAVENLKAQLEKHKMNL